LPNRLRPLPPIFEPEAMVKGRCGGVGSRSPCESEAAGRGNVKLEPSEQVI